MAEEENIKQEEKTTETVKQEKNVTNSPEKTKETKTKSIKRTRW